MAKILTTPLSGAYLDPRVPIGGEIVSSAFGAGLILILEFRLEAKLLAPPLGGTHLDPGVLIGR